MKQNHAGGIVALEDLEPPPAALQSITSDDLDHERQIDSVDANGESSMPSIHVSPPIVPVHASTAEPTITKITDNCVDRAASYVVLECFSIKDN